MSYQQYEKLTGETYFEACLIATKRFGKENFEVITAKRVKHPILFGFGHQEIVEITIRVRDRSISFDKLPENAPTRATLSTEVNILGQFSKSEDIFPIGSKSHTKPIAPSFPHKAVAKKNAGTSIPMNLGIRAYSTQKAASRHSSEMRNVHGLRSIQEENPELCQHHLPDSEIEPCEINDLLSQIKAVKEGRCQRDKAGISASPGMSSQHRSRDDEYCSPYAVSPLAPALNTFPTKFQESDTDICKTVSAMEGRMNQIYTLLKSLNKDSDRILEKTEPELPRGLLEVKKNLLALETPVEIVEQIVASLKAFIPASAIDSPIAAMNSAIDWFEKELRFSTEIIPNKKSGPVIIILVGPTGVGKTTTIAKLASMYGLFGRHSLALFTLDTFRIGATGQLNAYAEIIGCAMEIVYSSEEIDKYLLLHHDKDLIIVDTTGRCQKDTKEIFELSDWLEKLPSAYKFLVLSSTSKYTDMVDITNRFEKVGFDHLIFTKIDETNTIGPLLAMLYKTKKPLAYITDGQGVPNDFMKAEFQFFRDRLTPDTYL